jgi:hypothetical protein
MRSFLTLDGSEAVIRDAETVTTPFRHQRQCDHVAA